MCIDANMDTTEKGCRHGEKGALLEQIFHNREILPSITFGMKSVNSVFKVVCLFKHHVLDLHKANLGRTVVFLELH